MSNKTEAALHGRTLQDELRAAAPHSEDYSLLMRAASALDESERAAQFVIVDKRTGKLDWDGELHPSIEAAIESMCGQSQSYVRIEEEMTDEDRTVWSNDYEIRCVLPLANRPVQYRTVNA